MYGPAYILERVVRAVATEGLEIHYGFQKLLIATVATHQPKSDM